MNKNNLEKKLSATTSCLLREKGYISMVDVFVGLGYLAEKDVEAWRMKRIPYLERCIRINLSKISLIMKTVRKHCMQGNLKESYTAYKSWGKGAKQTLRFSKSGQEQIEKAYATHFLKPKP
ncbi:MAG: hypothetical protein Q9M30_09690 [Mariprofundaceae bacterium]|nr:hypothetical protein [Mariprofundaceae bacterium]